MAREKIRFDEDGNAEQVQEAQAKPQPEVVTTPRRANPPRCQHCKTDLELATAQTEFSTGLIVQIFYCANPECGATYGVQGIGVRQMKTHPAVTIPKRRIM